MDEKPGRHRTNPLVIAGNTAGVGFVAYIFVLLMLTKNGAAPNIFIPLTFFYFAALFGICIMILQYGRPREIDEKPAEERSEEPEYLRPATTAQLEESREFGIGSVTDATTRALDPAPIRERRN